MNMSLRIRLFNNLIHKLQNEPVYYIIMQDVDVACMNAFAATLRSESYGFRGSIYYIVSLKI